MCHAGSEVTAGTVNMDGKLRIRVCKTGAATTMSDILRLVENAQGRAAPVQRVADTVAGKFAVAVMGASFATLAFWGLAGPTLFPKVTFLFSAAPYSLQAAEYGICLFLFGSDYL